MWIVHLALRRPYTFIVLAIMLPLIGAIVLFGGPTTSGMATDIFPDIRIPVIGVVFNNAGLPPQEVAGRITSTFERGITTIVNDVEHVESNAYPGISVSKVFFQPGVDINLAMSQVTAFCQTLLRQMPAGQSPPLILKYSASSVPIIQLTISSPTVSESVLFDTANQFLRAQIATIRGAALPFPYGGAARQVQVDIDPAKLRAHGLSPQDVSTAIGNQNLVLPGGTQKIANIEYSVRVNGSPQRLLELNDLPIGFANGATTYLRDVATVHDGHPPQTNIVRVNGARAILMTIQKTGSASTLDIVNTIKERMPDLREGVPDGAEIGTTGDQSVFVKAAIRGVVIEALVAAALTALMILLFLGSWRSTVIIAISIPLSIMASILGLAALGETINIMTLGGLALAVGILVDDATVTIENINRHLEEGDEVEPAILKGSEQITVPALVSTLSICIVFVPMFMLSGVARYLFVPLAEAVVFAMLASYILSRSLVPTLSKYWLKTHADEEKARAANRAKFFPRLQQSFETRFERFRASYRDMLDGTIARGGRFLGIFLACVVVSTVLYATLGRNFFPDIDAGQIKLHLRAPTGTRVEEAALMTGRVEDAIRRTVPADEIESVVDNVGLPSSGINLTYGNSGVVGAGDADVLIALKPGHHSTFDYVRSLRQSLPVEFPDISFAFLPADIVSQILNFGLPAPIDVQIVGGSKLNPELANQLLTELRTIPGLVDLRVQQSFNQPELRVSTDRTRAGELGLTQRDVAGNLLLTLSGSQQTSPTFWLNGDSGVQYPLVTQTPQYQVSSIQDLKNIPLAIGTGGQQTVGGLADVTRTFGPNIVTRYDAVPVLDIYGAIQGRDLGAISNDIDQVLARHSMQLPKGTHLRSRGQNQTMAASYAGLLVGIAGAIVLVYLLIVINFQSWLDPLIVIAALPAALAGIAWMLFLTGTTLSVPALTGAIMCMGVATANSILVISFARDRLAQGAKPIEAAIDAGFTRFRPVLMTALAMVIGMSPMALGLGEGGEQNAPLGRAVIGGLVFATVATLLFVPSLFAYLHNRRQARAVPAQ